MHKKSEMPELIPLRIVSSTNCTTEELTERCDKVFNTFRGIYAPRWENALNRSETDFICIRKTWMSILAHYSIEIIEKALQDMVVSGKHAEFWPTPIQFNQICRATKKIMVENNTVEPCDVEPCDKAVPMPEEMRSYFNNIAKQKKVES